MNHVVKKEIFTMKGRLVGKVICYLVAMVLIIGLMFTGGTMAQEKKRTLTLWEYHMAEIPNTVGPRYEKFEEEFNVDLVIKTLVYPELSIQQVLACEAGEMPDLIEVATSIPPLAEKGGLEPLDSYIEREPGGREEFLSIFDPAFLIAPIYKDKLYFLPVYAGNYAIFYNKDMFKEAGIGHFPRNWDELRAALKKLTKPGQWGIAMDGADVEIMADSIVWLIAQNGGRVGLPPELGRVPEREVTIEDIGINNPEAVEAIEFLMKLIKVDKVVPSYASATQSIARQMFIAGKVAMKVDGPWAIHIFAPAEFEWGIAKMPEGPAGKGTLIWTGSDAYAMSTTCEPKDLGWEFIKFMTANEETITHWAKTSPNVFATYLGREIVAETAPIMRPFVEMLEWENVLDFISTMPPQFEAATDIFKMEIHKVVFGQKTVQEAMDTVAEGWKGLWDEWQEKYGVD